MRQNLCLSLAVQSMSGGVASLLRYAPDDVLRRTIIVLWVRQLKTEQKYMDLMLASAVDDGPASDAVDENAKVGELRGGPYRAGTLLGHEHLGEEVLDAVWVCFVPCVRRGESAQVHGFGKLVESKDTGWTSWAEAAKHAGSGVTPAEAAARDIDHPLKAGGTLFLWRLDPRSIMRLEVPIPVQRCYSPTPGPTPLHVSAWTLLNKLPAELSERMVCTVVPQPLTDVRAQGQRKLKASAELPLRLSQQEQQGAGEGAGEEGAGEEGAGEEGEEEGEEEGDGDGDDGESVREEEGGGFARWSSPAR